MVALQGALLGRQLCSAANTSTSMASASPRAAAPIPTTNSSQTVHAVEI